jgi:hypothetical protein
VLHTRDYARIEENLREKRIDGQFADEIVDDEIGNGRRLLHRMRGGFLIQGGFVGGAASEHRVAGTEVLDGAEARLCGLNWIYSGL